MTTTTIIILVLIGLIAGMLSGLIGIGGGVIIVPCLVYFLAFTQKDAQGTSLGLLMLPVGVLGVMQYYKMGHVDYKLIGILAIGFVLGSFLGSKLALTISDGNLKKIFAVIMILIACKILFFDKPKKDKTNLAPATTPTINTKT